MGVVLAHHRDKCMHTTKESSICSIDVTAREQHVVWLNTEFRLVQTNRDLLCYIKELPYSVRSVSHTSDTFKTFSTIPHNLLNMQPLSVVFRHSISDGDSSLHVLNRCVF